VGPTLPKVYTHVTGRHGFPGWSWTPPEKVKAGGHGPPDVLSAGPCDLLPEGAPACGHPGYAGLCLNGRAV
jgi:hypothetical protein